MNLSHWIDRHAAFTPNKTAIRFEGRTLTYRDLAVTIAQTAQGLQTHLGIRRGDRIAHLGYNSPELLILLFACARLGAMLVPLNWRLAAAEHLYIVQDAEVSALVVEEAFAGTITPVRQSLPHCQIVGLDFAPADGRSLADLLVEGSDAAPQGDLTDPLLIVYTSGTTGRPKGAVLTQSTLQWNAINSQHMHDLASQDHILTVLPMFHVGGLNIQTTPALHVGATVTLHRRFHPDQTLAAIANDKPTLTVLVPATIQACLASPQWVTTDFSRLRIVTTGSTPVPLHLPAALRRRGVTVLEVYGATETGPVAIYQRADSDFSRLGSTGLPALHCQVRVSDEQGQDLPAGQAGEILVKGPNVLAGYWRNETATRDALRAGWYHTGDIGYRDEAGYYFIVDRKKNMIKSGGESIYPAEIERVLLEHPAVVEVAVIGAPDEKWQEIPMAFVVAAPNSSLDETQLRHFAAGQLARYKIPQRFIFVETLPKNAMGKVQHFLLREQWHQLNKTQSNGLASPQQI
jgi:fatty-acyl-CoA synthase